MPIQGKVLENNARYTPVYEATHDVLTGGWRNDEVGRAAQATGNTDRNYIVQSAINSGREVKEGSHGGLIYKPKKASQPSEWGQKYRERKGINAIADSAVANGAKGWQPPSAEEQKAAFKTDAKNQTAFENYQNGVSLPGLTKEETFEQATGMTVDNYLKSVEEPEIKSLTAAAKSFRDEANEEYAKNLAADVAAGGTTTPEMFERFTGVPYDIYVAQGGLTAPKMTPVVRADQREAFNAARRVASEDTLMGDTYPDMQVASGYNGEPLPDWQQRFMENDPLRTVTPGREGGVYRTADGNYTTPSNSEMDAAYEEFKARTSGVDNSRGADDQEDRKYSYSPYVTYNDQSLSDAVSQWQQNRGARNALGAQTFSQDQQYEALYNSLRSHGLSRDNIMAMAEGEELPNLTPEQNMMLYYYAMNH